jgi:hypothetical protein
MNPRATRREREGGEGTHLDTIVEGREGERERESTVVAGGTSRWEGGGSGWEPERERERGGGRGG